MELRELKEHWLKLRREYARKLTLIQELEIIESQIEVDGMAARKRVLDHELDRIEYIEENDLTETRLLFETLLSQSEPELHLQYRNLMKHWEFSEDQEKQMGEWILFYQTLIPHLAYILHLRKGLRGFGLLKYLFGQNPTALITQEIQTIKRLMIAQKREFENPTLQHLMRLTQERWNFTQIDKEYAPILKQATGQLEVLYETQKKAVESKLAAEKSLYEWVENLG